MDGLTEGRIVHYVLNQGRNKGEHRAAIVAKVWRHPDPTLVDPEGKPVIVTPENGVSNIHIFTDAVNDELPGIMMMGSVLFDADGKPGTWHWIEKA